MVTGDDDELTAQAARRIGTVLKEKYRLDAVVGVGGVAAVYAATHRNRKQLAVKVLHLRHSFDSETRGRFLREGYVANTVDHPGTVAVLDDDVAEDGSAFLVMELLEGESVDALWERHGRRLHEDVVLDIADQLLDVLAAAHARGVVHRDVKPANVFLTRDGKVKLLDFGIARLHETAPSHRSDTGRLIGTPAFMAPEQALAKSSAIDARADVWSVGALMHTLLSGRVVHEAETVMHMLVKTAHDAAPSLRTRVPEASRDLVTLVDRALAFDRAERWQTATAMQTAVRLLQGRGEAAPISGTIPAVPARPAPASALERDVTPPPVSPTLPAFAPASQLPTLASEMLPPSARPASVRTFVPGGADGSGAAPSLALADAHARTLASSPMERAGPTPTAPRHLTPIVLTFVASFGTLLLVGLVYMRRSRAPAPPPAPAAEVQPTKPPEVHPPPVLVPSAATDVPGAASPEVTAAPPIPPAARSTSAPAVRLKPAQIPRASPSKDPYDHL